jgi:hypothetical protein
MSPDEKSKYLISELGVDGALIQCFEEWNNTDTLEEEYWDKVEIEIRKTKTK